VQGRDGFFSFEIANATAFGPELIPPPTSGLPQCVRIEIDLHRGGDGGTVQRVICIPFERAPGRLTAFSSGGTNRNFIEADVSSYNWLTHAMARSERIPVE
jgi:hypothetical protein